MAYPSAITGLRVSSPHACAFHATYCHVNVLRGLPPREPAAAKYRVGWRVRGGFCYFAPVLKITKLTGWDSECAAWAAFRCVITS